MTRLDFALNQIEFARNYTNDLLRHVHVDDWFRMPAEGVTHIAWQVGHLAMAEYRLLMERIRGVRPEDAKLMSKSFMQTFGRGSVPSPDSHDYPSPADIVGVFDRVHEHALAELAELADDELDQPPLTPHPLLTTKFDSLCWMAQHETLHAGQIGLLRRLFGQQPLR